MTLHEPTTTITDLILAVWSWALAFRLITNAEGQRSRKEWGRALLASGAAAFLGALFHGAGSQIDPVARQWLWKATTISVGVVSFYLATSAARASFSNPTLLRGTQVAATAKLIFYAAWMLAHDDFIYVIVDYAIAMIFVVILQLIDWRRATSRARRVLLGIAISIGGAIVQASGFTLHQHFNHNDLYHVIQLVATWMLYRGGMLLFDQQPSTPRFGP